MTISSRTPEGSPEQCRICGRWDRLERSDPAGEVICSRCERLFLQLCNRLVQSGVLIAGTSLLTPIHRLGHNSLDIVELIMELEEESGITVPDKKADSIRTLADLVRYIVAEIRRREDRR